MCGIICRLSFDGSVEQGDIQELSHRGPDGYGSWLSDDELCWMGHTRLAIQDLSSSGSQPICSSDNRIWVVFNGEIYNHKELRNMIHFDQWKGHSDSETLVEGLAQYGLSFTTFIKGMFAFVAYDKEMQRLICARDRLGIKPLYYKQTKSCITFASEAKALGGFNVDGEAISQVMSYGHLLPDYNDKISQQSKIRQVPNGYVCRIGITGVLNVTQYWPDKSKNTWSELPLKRENDTKNLIRKVITESIVEHLLSDVPICCLLSSGIDSAIIAGVANRYSKKRLKAFTLSFPGTECDESQMASTIADYQGLDHEILVPNEKQIVEYIYEALEAMDVPSVDNLNTYMISKMVRDEGYKIALSGLGADEIFGGYSAHIKANIVDMLQVAFMSGRIGKILMCNNQLKRKFGGSQSFDRYSLIINLRRWISSEELNEAGLQNVKLKNARLGIPNTRWGIATFAELTYYTEPMLLRDCDNMSMANGLEIRVPFLDHEVVELAIRLPTRFRQARKRMLVHSFRDYFPPNYKGFRRKKGFELPMTKWMKGTLREKCEENLLVIKESGLINKLWVDAQWKKFLAGDIKWMKIWALVVLGELAKREINNTSERGMGLKLE